jgi:hypothetical protein
MKYLLAVYGDSSRWGTLNEAAARAETEALERFDRDARQAGSLITRAPLGLEGWKVSAGQPVARKETPRDEVHRLGCFYVIECRDAAEAKEWAARFPLIGPGGFESIEIRPITDDSD